jgi:hypothetical protein
MLELGRLDAGGRATTGVEWTGVSAGGTQLSSPEKVNEGTFVNKKTPVKKQQLY